MPPDSPDVTITQIALLATAGASFAASFFFALQSIRKTAALPADAPEKNQHVLGPAARVAFAVGVFIAIALVAWRIIREDSHGAGGLTTGENFRKFSFFDLFLLLGLLLAAIAVYFRITRRLRSLSFFLLPIIAVVLLLGSLLSLLYNRAFEYTSVSNVIHVVSILTSSIAFALGCAGGIVYLIADRQLKKKGLTHEHRWLMLPSLASMERFNLHAVLIGFPLLTLAMITGAIILRHSHQGTSWASPKVILAIVAWLIYGILIHIPLAPSFRGRRAAWLIIAGFAVLLSVFFLVRSL